MNTETEIPSAGVVLCYQNGLVLAVSRKNNPDQYGLPGGKREPGETTKQAAERELEEETGHEVIGDLIRIFSRVEPGKDGKDFFSVCYYTGEVEWMRYPKEGLKVTWVTPEFLMANSPFGEYLRQLFEATEIIPAKGNND